jgi:CheY-like chemotaxis protein
METPGIIVLKVTVEQSHAVFSIRDSGIGISPEALPKLFNLFSRVHSAAEGSPSGLGIGLALVRQLAALHGGTVSASSPGLNLGSEFTVKLPLASITTEHLPQTPVKPEQSALDARPRRVLVADDNPEALESLGLLLEISGHEVRKSGDGGAAFQMAATWRPEVVLLDIGMPVLNGYDVAKRIRSETWGATMILVAISGWGQAEDRQRATEAGFDMHVRKPIGLPLLEEILAAGTRSTVSS